MSKAAANERGIALLIVLMIVAVLTITVMEFTYSVELDQHRARHALQALQAQLLARSGVNIAQAFLIQDQEPKFDSYTEDWWLQLQQFCTGLEIDPTMRIKCGVEDESGKININSSKMSAASLQQTGQPRTTKDAYIRDALRRLFDAHQIPVANDQNIGDALEAYWQQDPPPGEQTVPFFKSVEEFAAYFQIPTRYLPRLRHLLTTRSRTGINVNTADPEVLTLVINDDKSVQQIVEDRADQPIQNTGQITSTLSNNNVANATVVASLFGVRSQFFRLEASAVANADPSGAPNTGIGQTVSLLVERKPTRQAQGDPGPLWTLSPLDWQKEGGARLFSQHALDDTDDGNHEGGLDPLSGVP